MNAFCGRREVLSLPVHRHFSEFLVGVTGRMAVSVDALTHRVGIGVPKSMLTAGGRQGGGQFMGHRHFSRGGKLCSGPFRRGGGETDLIRLSFRRFTANVDVELRRCERFHLLEACPVGLFPASVALHVGAEWIYVVRV